MIFGDSQLLLLLAAVPLAALWLALCLRRRRRLLGEFGQWPQVERLLGDAGIVRNRQKIDATIANAKAFLKIQKEHGSFDAFVWGFVDGKPRQNSWKTMKRIPATTKESDALSQALKERGFKFAGSTICYAYMQAAGMVNDHVVACFRYLPVKRLGK